jgi:ankyrin repeat protein
MLLSFTVFLTLFRATFASKLTDAAARGDLAAVEEMITQNLFSVDDIDDDDEESRTALIFAAVNGHPEVVNFLIRNKANVNHGDHHDFTPLMEASLRGHAEVVKILLLNKAELERLAFGGTALQFAVDKGYPDRKLHTI